jgi:hypothetical protein
VHPGHHAPTADCGFQVAGRIAGVEGADEQALVLRPDRSLPTDIRVILSLSPRTVEEYLAKACDKLGVRRRVQAVVRARRLGLLDEEP